MNKQQLITSTTLLAGALGFNVLFWSENLGANYMIFAFFLLTIAFASNPSVVKSKPALIAAAGVMVASVMVVYHNSFVAKFTGITSMITFVGFLNQKELKAIFYAIPTSFWNFGLAPRRMVELFHRSNESKASVKKYARTFKIVLLPLLFFVTFYVIFHFSNPVFAEYSNSFWQTIGEGLHDIFAHISIGWIGLFLLGICLIAWILFQSDLKHFLKVENGLSETITRASAKLKKRTTPSRFKNVDLKNEYRSAVYLIVSINVLLLIINTIDVSWLWFNFEYDKSMNLSQFVHEGTYLLILSILLSMGILLYFFRKNLNFYVKKKTLTILATIWIIQNLILVISVAVRNYHYIYHFGLAYKRIGVILFLTATIVGLVTLYIKINKSKSSYYLLKVNSWGVYALLIFMSVMNWDMIIVNHNLNHSKKENIDIEFLLTLSDKTLPVIYEHRNEFNLEWWDYSSDSTLDELLDRRIRRFKARKVNTTWRSWNYAEERAYQKLIELEE